MGSCSKVYTWYRRDKNPPSRMFKFLIKTSLILLNGHNCLISHSLYNLSPAPYLSKQLSFNKYRHYGAAKITKNNVFRDTQDIIDAVELHDAIRTQDNDSGSDDFALSLPYSSPFYGTLVPHTFSTAYQDDRSTHGRKLGFNFNYLSHLGVGHKTEPEPYKYSIYKVPDCAITNKHYYNISFCLEDPHYPVDTIKHELDRNMRIVARMMSDISYQSADNLVDGLTKYEEEKYSYNHNSFRYDPEDDSGGYVCSADVFYARPKRAQNTFGEWKVIVNLPDNYYESYESGHAGHPSKYQKYTQTTRLEQCRHPHAPCSFISQGVKSSCLQKHNFVRLMAYTFDQGLHIDSFKLPVSCSCHVTVSTTYGPLRLQDKLRVISEPPIFHSTTPAPISHSNLGSSITAGNPPKHLPIFITSNPEHVPRHSTTALPAHAAAHVISSTLAPMVVSTPLYQPSPNPYKVNLG